MRPRRRLPLRILARAGAATADSRHGPRGALGKRRALSGAARRQAAAAELRAASPAGPVHSATPGRVPRRRPSRASHLPPPAGSRRGRRQPGPAVAPRAGGPVAGIDDDGGRGGLSPAAAVMGVTGEVGADRDGEIVGSNFAPVCATAQRPAAWHVPDSGAEARRMADSA